jgi:hypothetical protein
MSTPPDAFVSLTILYLHACLTPIRHQQPGQTAESSGTGDPYLILEVMELLKRVSVSNNNVLVVFIASRPDAVDVNIRSKIDESIELIGRVDAERGAEIVKKHLGEKGIDLPALGSCCCMKGCHNIVIECFLKI